MKKIGNWKDARKVIGGLQNNCNIARKLSLTRFALKAEGIAKNHLSQQDLDWEGLSPKYKAQKIRKGQSDKILIATSSYFQAITSYTDDDTAYIGVKKTAKDSEGNIIADIAATHEFGSIKMDIPARPLWQPTLDETYEWHLLKNTPEQLLKQVKKML